MEGVVRDRCHTDLGWIQVPKIFKIGGSCNPPFWYFDRVWFSCCSLRRVVYHTWTLVSATGRHAALIASSLLRALNFLHILALPLVFFFTTLNKEFRFVHNLKWFLWREKENHSIYIRCSLGACFLGFALFTLSLHYIYTRWSLSACSCSPHTLLPYLDLNN